MLLKSPESFCRALPTEPCSERTPSFEEPNQLRDSGGISPPPNLSSLACKMGIGNTCPQDFCEALRREFKLAKDLLDNGLSMNINCNKDRLSTAKTGDTNVYKLPFTEHLL